MTKALYFVKKNYIYILALLLGILIFNFESIKLSIIEIPSNFKAGSLFFRYSTENENTWLQFLERTQYYFSDIINWFRNFNFIVFLNQIINFTFDFMIYFINYFINFVLYFYLFFYIFVSKDVYETKYTRSARAFVNYVSFLRRIKSYVKQYIIHLKNNKMKLFIGLMFVLLCQSFLIKLISETFIFLYYYMMSSYNLDLHLTIWYVIKSIILFVYIEIPLWLGLIIAMFLTWKTALYRAEKKKEKNHDQLKVFTKYDLPFQTIINGVPGVGKTRLLVQLALAIEENHFDEIEETLHSIETSYPAINFGDVIKNKYLHVTKYPDHFEYYKLLNRKTSSIMTVPFAILDPYLDDFSHQLDFEYIRPNSDEKTAPLEKYTVLVISELDKEYNSHYTKKEVGEDGIHVFFGIGSHWFERTAKILIDYQIQTQVPLNIRGNAELFIKIEETKYKMPFLLNLFTIPFKWLYEIFDSIILSYESYKIKLVKYSQRNTKRIRKRFDYTLIYSILRHLLFYLEKILMFFRKFLYIKFYCIIMDLENKAQGKIKLNVNHFDESWKGSRLYDSTFLSKAYKEKKQKGFDWDCIPKWSSLTPDKTELEKVHSRFIDSAFKYNNNTEKGDQFDTEEKIIEFN